LCACAVVCTLLATSLAGCGQPGSNGDARLATRLQAAVDDFLGSRLVLGASVAVIEDDQLVEVVAGSTDLGKERAVTVDTQFRVASVTKLYLATVVLKLVERDEVSLDEPIGVHALELPQHLAFARDLTLRQLLSHTSGLSQTFTRDEDRFRALTTAEQLDRIPPAVCQPSSCWSYADGNYVLAQLVLEAATGLSLADLIHDELLEPLGLEDTTPVDAGETDVRLPPQYALVPDGSGQPLEPRRLFEQSLPRIDTLITTAADAARFADAVFAGDVLSPTSLHAMLDTTAMRDLPCVGTCVADYGLGVFHFDVGGRRLVGHDGSSGTVVVHDQHSGRTVAILTNGGDQDMGAFLKVVLNAIDNA
jgi:CubicO group peptidase (beta-lactamase class C family)